jgi:hypothetical protein
MPMPSPELAAMFAKTDELFAGLSPDEELRAVRTLYYDSDGEPQARSLRIWAVERG